MAAFLIGSVLCALSRSLEALVAARIVQGIGGAMMTPVGRRIIVEMSPKKRLVSAMAWFTTPALVGPMIGPPLAGFLLEVGPWPWIFLINPPLAALTVYIALRHVPETRDPNAPSHFDFIGAVLAALAVA